MTDAYSSNLVLVELQPVTGQHPAPWAGLAVGAALLIAVALLARRRAGRNEPRAASRVARIVETAIIWSVAYTAMRAPGFVELGALGLPIEVNLLTSGLLFLITALLLVGTADLLLDSLGPRRTLLWLVAGPLLIAGFSIGLLAASHWMDIVSANPGWREIMLVAGLLIAGLGWWSRLPSWESQASEIFD